MTECPGKGPDTTVQGRAIGPELLELCEAGSVHGPSTRTAKWFTLPVVLAIAAFYLQGSEDKPSESRNLVTKILLGVTGYVVIFSLIREVCLTGSVVGVSKSEDRARSPGDTLSVCGHSCAVAVCPRGRRSNEGKASAERSGADDPRRDREAPSSGAGLSAGWRSVAESCHATGGQSHE